jgi:hypothetical protein
MAKVLPAALLGLVILAPVISLAAGKDVEIDEKKIYYGDPDNFKKAAVLKLAQVFKHIPEYQEAKKRGKDDPQYYILLEKANQKFFAAMESVAGAEGYDLIGEVGAIKIKGKKVPNITKSVIEALPE